jgi:hypothetical protein
LQLASRASDLEEASKQYVDRCARQLSLNLEHTASWHFPGAFSRHFSPSFSQIHSTHGSRHSLLPFNARKAAAGGKALADQRKAEQSLSQLR